MVWLLLIFKYPNAVYLCFLEPTKTQDAILIEAVSLTPFLYLLYIETMNCKSEDFNAFPLMLSIYYTLINPTGRPIQNNILPEGAVVEQGLCKTQSSLLTNNYYVVAVLFKKMVTLK